MRLENKIAVITGAGSGIGRETALLFAKEGAKVVVADISERGGMETVGEIKGAGGEGVFIRLDVSSIEQAKQMVKETHERYGRIDILIINAGIVQDALIIKMTEEQWDRVINVNLKGAFNCIKAVVDVMINQGSGVIINASSIVGVYGNIGQANYASAKAGLIGMTKSLAKELGRKGIRINAVAPGFIRTPMVGGVPEKVLEMVKEKTPLRRLGEPRDIAYAYLYLASDEAGFVNGAVIPVDGGLVL
ncbi:3-oxoacyl-ACP reductase FabG [Candidatus Methanoperedens nitratireducens]|uniref:3-oxoacyl-(Acyl-carrier-protein) reductase FabG n=1 Tax=Candidatus Methanoperedens nitratireducens TaxID=1392998 RepID=A0A284VK60_9EURY|nr:3-oxoacyl-ACP reductase FabG [Candidatus Methanoperedens nitroreducens]SNQ59655.1 3-oxoacyl-(acyl-carrier-protein) reductase FabG [Candidatus Methanoperedens nitroreducens]